MTTAEEIIHKITELRGKDEEFQKKYGMDYSVFGKRTSSDDEYVKSIETTISKTWEADLADWEFCHTGIEEWTQRLQDIKN